MKRLLLFGVALLAVACGPLKAQVPTCESGVPYFYYNFVGHPAMDTVSPTHSRNDQCCGGPNNAPFTSFEVVMDTGAAMISFEFARDVDPGQSTTANSMYWQLNCGPQINIDNAVCLTSTGTNYITFTKPGNNANTYRVRSIAKPIFPRPDSVRIGCSHVISILGMDTTTVTFQSITGTPGQYNNLLSCTTGCVNPVYTPVVGVPSVIQYRVCGTPQATACGYTAVCDTVTIYNFAPLTVTASPNPAVFCAGGPGETSVATPLGGLAPYTYFWRNSSSTVVSNTNSYSTNVGGAYSIEVRDVLYEAGRCSTIAVSVPFIAVPAPLISAGTDQTVCPGAPAVVLATLLNSSATGVTWTGAGSFSPHVDSALVAYTPTPGEVTSGVAMLIATTTGVGGGCDPASDTVYIHYPSSLTVTVADQALSCSGDSTTIAPIVTGGTFPYTFAWSNGDTDSTTFSGQGTYCVTVTDALGCTATDCGNVTTPAPLTLSMSSIDCSTNISTDGSATALPGGGTPPYSYLWNTGATTPTISSLAFGVYSVTVTDANGCTISASVVVNKPLCLGFQATTTSTNVLCYGNKTGSATATPIGGSGAYSYVWNTSPVQTTQTATNLGAGVYQVAVIDMITGCVHITNVTITQPPQLTTTTTQVNVTTIGGNNGSATVNAFGGTPGYTYLWSNGDATATTNSLIAGTYSVTVTDANGCAAENSVLINQPPCNNLTAAVNSTPVTCAGGTNGTATAITLFATPPLTYLWSTGATTQSISGLGAGTYSVTVTDAANCPAIVNFTITQPSPFVANAIGTNVICSGDGNGTVELFVSGGTFPYSYMWSNGLTVQDQTGLGAGTYSVTVTDANGCTTTASGVVVDPSPLQIPSSVTPVTCFGGNNGAIDINPIGGTAGYTYSWTNAATSQDISGLTAGGYTVTVTDVNGCTAAKQYWVSHPDVVSDSFSIACPVPGSGVATVTVVPSGGNSVFYQISYNNGGSYSASGVYTTTLPVDSIYLLQVRDSLGCTLPIADTIAIDPSVAISAVTFNPCVPDGATTVPVTVTATGGNGGPLSISFDGGVTYLAPGVFTANLPVDSTYTLVVKDSSDCGSMTQTFTINPEIVPSAVVTTYASGFNVTCFGASNGNIDLSVIGGNGSYTYAWSSSATTQDLNNITAASYSVVITDGLGCRDTANFVLTQPTLLTATAAATTNFNGFEISCFGGTNGAIDLTPGGGTTGYTYNWSNAATTQDLSGLGIGTYSVTVTDANGCTATSSVVMTQPAALATTTTVVPVACFGNSTASIDLGVTGGVTTYTYLWSNAATTQDLTNIPLGTYSVTVTDANSCTTTTTATITQPPLLTSSGNVTNLTCFQSGNGGIDVTVSGGVSTYTYAWSNSATTQDLSSLTANTYSVTITDQNGCTNTLSFTVTQPTLLTATAAATTNFNGYQISCFGGTNGAIDLTPGGGTTGYTYSWSNLATTQDLSGLGIGTYSVTVTDANGCTATASVVMTQPTALATTTALTQILCNGDSTGIVDLGVSGGVTTYTFAWSNGATTEDISGIPIGTYSVTVTDANSCTTTASAVITEPTLLVTSGVVTNLTCFQAGNGSIDVTANGGVGPYDYQWSSTDTTQDLSNLSAGLYDVVITDLNGCDDTLTFTVTEPALLTAITTATTNFNGYQISCNGNTDGAIDLQVAGGTLGYNYLWSTGDTTEDISALGAGTYIVNITDAQGCTVADTLVLNEPAALGTIVAAHQVYCNGFNTGSIDLTVGGGVAPFDYLWSTTDTTQDLSNLVAGTYSVTITDANGCIIIDSAVVTEPTPLVFSDSVTNLSCFQSNDGSINLAVSGGLVPYSYAWSSGQTSEDISSLSAGLYTVIISDSAACGDTLSFTITEPAQLTIVASADTSFNGYEIRCNGLNDGSASTAYAGGTPGYTFAWSTGENTPNLDSLAAGTYVVFVTDSNGCTASDTIVFNEPALITFSGPHQDVLCNGFETGSIDGTTNGGVTPYGWLWSNGETTEDIDSLAVGVYSVTITDANGCELDSTITITEMSPVLSTHVSANVLCFGNQDGSIDVTVVGGGAPYVYTWSSGQTTEDLSGVGPGTYIVVITDTNNCTHNDTVYIVEPALLTSSVYSPVSSNGYNVSGYGATDGSVDLTVAGGTAPYQYGWSNGSTTEDLSGLGAGTYIVSVIDSNGCAVSDTIVITEPLDLEMPTGYSPNGDGANDFFVVHGIEAFPINKLEVFNRWGNLVYDADGYHNQWSGTSNTGDELPDGTYFVILTINDGAMELHGYVDIRR